jgi:hypothetical protein
MEIAVTIAVVVLLAVVTLLVARAGAGTHQEDLSGHQDAVAGGEARDEGQGRPDQPNADRPAGPDAEAMGVRDAGANSVDPTGEQPDR